MSQASLNKNNNREAILLSNTIGKQIGPISTLTLEVKAVVCKEPVSTHNINT